MAAKNGLEMNSVIGEGSIFEGKFYISGSLQIDGRFQGEIRTENQVVVGETGKVKTDILAKRVVVAGTVIGNIEESFESGPKLDEIIKGPQGPRESDKESPQDA